MITYRPRTQSKRWLDGDCPSGVLAIYDNPEFADRYTVLYKPLKLKPYHETWIMGRGMSSHPYHPQGFGMSFENQAHEIVAYRNRSTRKACRWSDLPPDVQRCVREDCAEAEVWRTLDA